MRLNKTLSVVALSAALVVTAAGTALAASDTNVCTPGAASANCDSTLVAVGSDTADDVMSALATQLTFGGAPAVSTYTATGTNTIATKNLANCAAVPRPNGSGQGLAALKAAANIGGTSFSQVIGGVTFTNADMTNCVQIARSSRAPRTNNLSQLSYVPYAIDSVSYATTSVSAIPKNLTLAQLKVIYKANGTPGTSSCPLSAYPLIPQAGSGTRGFWATTLGVTDDTRSMVNGVTAGNGTTQFGSCVREVKSDNVTPIQEHTANLETTTQLVPFSTAQWIAQKSGVITPNNTGARSSLNAIDFDGTGVSGTAQVSPFVLQQNFKSTAAGGATAAREIYNVFTFDVVNNAANPLNAEVKALFASPTATLCADPTARATIQRYGFDLDPNCGIPQND